MNTENFSTAEPIAASKMANRQVVAFKVADQTYALPIEQIKEVVITPAIAPIPLSAPYIKGVANVRGRIITLIDLEIRFGLAASDHAQNGQDSAADQSQNYTLVIESTELKLGILVRQMPSTLMIQAEQIDQNPAILSQHALGENSYIKGIIKLNDQIIVLTDMDWIIAQFTKNEQLIN